MGYTGTPTYIPWDLWDLDTVFAANMPYHFLCIIIQSESHYALKWPFVCKTWSKFDFWPVAHPLRWCVREQFIILTTAQFNSIQFTINAVCYGTNVVSENRMLESKFNFQLIKWIFPLDLMRKIFCSCPIYQLKHMIRIIFQRRTRNAISNDFKIQKTIFQALLFPFFVYLKFIESFLIATVISNSKIIYYITKIHSINVHVSQI